MKPLLSSTILFRSRKMRHEMTMPERRLWYLLRNNALKVKFRRQHPFGSYILDFYCHKKNLAIEIDGETHGESNQKRYDNSRTKYLKENGITVLRFWNTDVMKNIEGVYEVIFQAINSPSPQPSPDGTPGEGENNIPSPSGRGSGWGCA